MLQAKYKPIKSVALSQDSILQMIITLPSSIKPHSIGLLCTTRHDQTETPYCCSCRLDTRYKSFSSWCRWGEPLRGLPNFQRQAGMAPVFHPVCSHMWWELDFFLLLLSSSECTITGFSPTGGQITLWHQLRKVCGTTIKYNSFREQIT